MNLSSLEHIKKLCQQYGIVPRRDHGQNFLIDEEALSDIIDAAALSKQDIVLEIGPGFGVLTEQLAAHVKEVVAVELDKKLVVHLKKKFQNDTHISIVHEDILQWLATEYLNISIFKYFKIVANLPYQITSRVLRVLLESPHRPSLLVVMVQKEVAERIVATPGDMSLLSVMVQYYAQPEIVRIVPRTSFWPEPEVDSAIVRIRPFVDPSTGLRMTMERSDDFFRIVKMGFASRRKQLMNNLAAGLQQSKEAIAEHLRALGFAPTVRAQELSVDQWKGLVHRVLGTEKLKN